MKSSNIMQMKWSLILMTMILFRCDQFTVDKEIKNGLKDGGSPFTSVIKSELTSSFSFYRLPIFTIQYSSVPS